MRSLKLFGLAAVAAVAMMALVGAGTAAAEGTHEKTDLCKVKQTPCEEGNKYPSGTVIRAVLVAGKQAVLKAQAESGATFEISCQKSEIEGKTKEEQGSEATLGSGESQLKGNIEKATFEECTTSLGGECTVEPLQLNWQASVTQAEPQPEQQGNGHLQVYEREAGSGQPGARIECPGVINCIFKVKEKGQEEKEVGKLQVTGGEPAHVTANQLELKPSLPPEKGDCTPILSKIKQGFWDAEYEVKEPNPLYVEHQVLP